MIVTSVTGRPLRPVMSMPPSALLVIEQWSITTFATALRRFGAMWTPSFIPSRIRRPRTMTLLSKMLTTPVPAAPACSPQRVIPGGGADDPSMVVRPGTSRPDASLIPPPTANSMVPPSRAALASASRNDPGPESASVVTLKTARPAPRVVLKPNPGCTTAAARGGEGRAPRCAGAFVAEHAGVPRTSSSASDLRIIRVRAPRSTSGRRAASRRALGRRQAHPVPLGDEREAFRVVPGDAWPVRDADDRRVGQALVDEAVEPRLDGLVERCRGLVEEQPFRLLEQRARDRQALLLAEAHLE